MADRIDREIEEILRKLDDFLPDTPARRASRKSGPGKRISAAQQFLARRLAAISLPQVMMWSLLVVLVSFFIRGIPGAAWLMVAALVVFGTAFVISIATGGRGARPAPEKRWRGQPVNYSGPGWPDRIKAWIKGRHRR